MAEWLSHLGAWAPKATSSFRLVPRFISLLDIDRVLSAPEISRVADVVG